MSNRSILVIYTGGTIGMMVDPESKALKPFEFKNLQQQLPMLPLIGADITFKDMLPLIDSSDTNADFWIRLAKMIGEEYDHYDGFVILHGTDTMAYTASALSFLLENLAKPVILTGSQLPLGVIRTDGRRNILNAIAIAAEYKDDKPMIQEVCIYFQNNLYRGNRTYKDNASRFNAFSSPNYPKLAEVNTNIEYHKSFIHVEEPVKPLVVHDKMDDNIAIVKLYPGIRHDFLQSVFATPGLRAIVMETFGVGNAPTNPEFIQLLKETVNKGILIVNVTQCKGGGGVEMGRYLTGKHLADVGILSGHDMTTEAAVTKLMFLLGQYQSNEKVKQKIENSLCGELTIE
ncbi:MAG: type I asparaginase [Bacteroidales bacterium]|nr:type I asparaginase [Bacteroidales bacterium]